MMQIYSMKHRKLFFSVLILFLLNGIITVHPNYAAAAPNLHGITVATVDSNKELAPKGKFDIIQITRIGGSLGATISQIEVDGNIDGMRVLGFADTDTKADRGWYFVDNSEAAYWIARFGGNPNYILGGSANVYSKTVSNKTTFNEYQAYNLAELATASGGAGYTKGDNLVPNGSGGYISVGHFRTTPQPTGAVTTDKTKYNVNETVTISANATDYSYYDRGIFVWSLSVINKTTGRGYKSFLTNQDFRDPSGTVPTVNETSNPPGYTWTYKNTEYKPTEPGVYEVSLTITDLHHRSRQGSSSISVSTPYIAQFTVGEVTPGPEAPDPEEPDPTPSCSIETTKTKMDIQVVGDKDIKNYTAVSSGGSDVVVEKNAEITVFAKKNGTFTLNGSPMATGSGGNKKVGIGSIGSSGRVKVVYRSDDGTECWEKYFRVEAKDGEDKCPIITLNNSVIRNGETIEILPIDKLYFKATYKDKYGETGPAEIKWDVTQPNGSVVTLPGQYDDKDRWRTYNSDKLNLPSPPELVLEKGKTYKLKLNYSSSLWEGRPECDFEITIVVKDASCSIAELRKVVFFVHGQYPNPFSPEGDSLNSSSNGPSTLPQPVYMRYFTDAGDYYETNIGFSTKLSGRWYLNRNGQKLPLTDGVVPANQKFDLKLPNDVDVGDTILISFESENGCVGELTFTIVSDRKCPDILVSVETKLNSEKWSKNVKRGETIELAADELQGDYWFRMFLSQDSSYMVKWFDPNTGMWERKRDGKYLYSSSGNKDEDHWLLFPTGNDGLLLDGLYQIEFSSYEDENCHGFFFVKIGEGSPGPDPDGENLLIVKNSFDIDPGHPQAPGTEATITFNVKNAGKLTHDTKLAVRWESSEKETILDVNDFKPGEVRKITVPTKYPQKTEDFIANINPSKNKPDNETIWPDNRAEWPVKIVGGNIPQPPGGGENYDGGEIALEIFDSENRQLQKLPVQADGVWEREPAKIRVVIDQAKINEGFQKTQQQINQKITEYKQQLEQSVSGEDVRNITVTASPGWIADAKSLAVYTPALLDLQVTGPGIPQQWQVASTSMGGEFVYTGTHVPTQTTWRQVLQNQPYKAQINGFVIAMDYKIDFTLTYDVCSKGEEDEETCETQTAARSMTGRYTITVKGSERTFAVFEPNATSSIQHTPEWLEYHSRDRYKDSAPNDFYAGERILPRVELQDRHRHPVSGQFPLIVSAKAWIFETGRRQTSLQSLLPLRAFSNERWGGHSYAASKLGTREAGVDTLLMGDKQYGFEKGGSYAVYYQVQFRFGVDKGFPYLNKTSGQGHEQADYRVPFRIIANAWERQGIRNHTTQ
ncbi:ABC transporter permease [Brevibacillus gelatini]|uniref:ABC transporter permease n=1 Tax=Brevibacillus gelatini TaxID=1655277 RepID=UPI003D813A92